MQDTGRRQWRCIKREGVNTENSNEKTMKIQNELSGAGRNGLRITTTQPITDIKNALRAAILASALLAAGGVVAHDGEDDGPDIAVTGTLTVLQADDFEHHSSEVFYSVQDAHSHQSHKLRFKGKPPADVRTGDKVALRGKARNEEIEVSANGTDFQTVEQAEPLVSGVQKTVVILINFMDVALECSPTDVKNRMFGNQQSVDGVYRETSYGNVSFSGDVLGPYTINYLSTEACDPWAWAAAAEAAATKRKRVDLSRYTRRVYVLPRAGTCGWAGLGTIGGNPSQAWIKTCDLADVYAHELGHNVTMHHASTDSNNDGVRDCEYCDVSDLMGYGGIGLRQVNAPHKEQMGWLPAGKIVSVTGSGTFNIAPLEIFPSNTAYPQALKIPTGSGDYYYVSYRRRLGYDSNLSLDYADRANIHRYAGGGAVQTSFIGSLVDSGTFITSSGMTIQQLSHGSDYVTVQVKFCVSSVSPSCTTIGPAGGSGSVSVTSDCSWTVTAVSDWIIPSVTSGTGNGALSYTVAANTTGTDRTGALLVAGKVLTVNQAAALPGPTGLAPDNYGLADYFGTLTWEPVTGADRYYGVVYYWNGQSWVFWTQFSTTGQNATSARVGGLQNTYLAWAVIAGDDVSCSGQVPYWGNWSAWAFCYSPIW